MHRQDLPQCDQERARCGSRFRSRCPLAPRDRMRQSCRAISAARRRCDLRYDAAAPQPRVVADNPTGYSEHVRESGGAARLYRP